MTPEEQAERDELERLELKELEEREQQEKQAPSSDIGGIEAFGLGVSQALSPIAKYGAAAGIKARTAIEDLARGKPSMGVPFDIATQTAEEQFEAARKQRPGAYYSGMAGGIGLQGLGAAKAAVPSLLKGIGIGAGTGAAYSAGDVPIEEIKKDPFAPVGPAIVGGSIGAAIPAGITALGTQRQAATAGAIAAAKELSSEPLQLFGIPKAISEGVKTTYGAAREPAQMKEVVRQIAPELPKPTLGSQILSGGAVTPQEEAQFLLNLLQQGKTPAKEFFTQKATQLYPGQTGPQQLRNVLDIPLEQRVQARGFDPSAMGRELLPQAEAAKTALGKKGAAFQELQGLAAQEYKRTQLPTVSNAIKLAKAQYERPGTSALARNTVEEIDTIINQGSALPRYGVTEGPLKSANAQEAYKRMQAAREYADRAIRKNPQDLSVQDVLMPLRDSLDEVLKSSPSKVIADALYAKGKRVTQLGIKPLEMPVGDKQRMLSGKAIQSALGDTQQGEKLALGIEEARQFTKEFGAQLGPTEAAKIDKFFDALADARTVADRKRVLDQLKFAEGPSGAAIRAGIEKLQQTIKPAPGGASMFRAAPEYLQSVDAFMADKARQYFNKPFDKLSGGEQYKLVNAYQWFKENPNATMQEMNEAFTRILKGKGK